MSTRIGGPEGKGNRIRSGDASKSQGGEARETLHGGPGAEGGGGTAEERQGAGGGTGQDGIQGAGETGETVGGEAGGGDGGGQRRITVADAARLQRHRNPLDAIAEAIRVESRGRGPQQVRVERVLARIVGLGLSANALQEGIENLVSLELVAWMPGGTVRWRGTDDEKEIEAGHQLGLRWEEQGGERKSEGRA